MNNTVLVSGGTGFIGSHVIEQLLENKFNVILLKRSFSDTWRIENIINEITSYDLDNIRPDDIFKKNNISSIFHIATHYKKFHSFEDIDPLISSNIAFPVKLLELAEEFNVNHFINTGSFFEYSNEQLPVTEDNAKNPFNLYATTKLSFENILKSYSNKGNIKSVTLKIFSPYGPKDNEQKLIPTLIKKALENKKIQLSYGLQKLDFVYVKDIAEAYIQCFKNKDSMDNYETINIGNGFPYSIRDIVSIIEEILGYSVKKSWGEPAVEDIDIIFSSIVKAREIINWEPKYSINDGLKETIDYYRD